MASDCHSGFRCNSFGQCVQQELSVTSVTARCVPINQTYPSIYNNLVISVVLLNGTIKQTTLGDAKVDLQRSGPSEHWLLRRDQHSDGRAVLAHGLQSQPLKVRIFYSVQDPGADRLLGLFYGKVIRMEPLPMTAAEALKDYYRTHYFGDRALTDRWIWFRLWKISLPFPNSRGRRNAIALHDLHHVLTGYKTDWAGEGEVAAWELASGFPPEHRVGYSYAPLTLIIGLLIAPFRICRAWRRGKNRMNLCHLDVELGREKLMSLSLPDLKRRLELN